MKTLFPIWSTVQSSKLDYIVIHVLTLARTNFKEKSNKTLEHWEKKTKKKKIQPQNLVSINFSRDYKRIKKRRKKAAV